MNTLTTLRLEIGAYLALALAGFIGTQWAVVETLRAGDIWSTLGATLWANPIAAFITIDLTVVAVAGLMVIAIEGRRAGVRWWPLYFALTFLVAISVSLPLFLAARRWTIYRNEWQR